MKVKVKTKKLQTMFNQTIAGFGWRPSKPDIRDIPFKVDRPVVLPLQVDLRHQCPEVYDQGQLGSCTANAWGAAYEFDLIKQGARRFMPSRLFIYYSERARQGTIPYDSGASLRDGAVVLNQVGTCDEQEWKYNIEKFDKTPSKACYTIAARHKSLRYNTITGNSLYLMKQCLAKGFPFVFGFTVYESFQDTSSNGIVRLPNSIEQVVGGHAIMAVGYTELQKRFIIRNSWGSGWGDGGYCYMPYEYLTDRNLSADFWMMTLVP